jgi:hypothetical protein
MNRHLRAVTAPGVFRKTRPMKCPVTGRQLGHSPLQLGQRRSSYAPVGVFAADDEQKRLLTDP